MPDDRTDEPREQPFLEPGILDLLLTRHPAQVHLDELVRSSPEDRVLVEDAVMNLVADGLAHRHGDFVAPTRAAVRFRELGL
jgi:hypothetical protein